MGGKPANTPLLKCHPGSRQRHSHLPPVLIPAGKAGFREEWAGGLGGRVTTGAYLIGPQDVGGSYCRALGVGGWGGGWEGLHPGEEGLAQKREVTAALSSPLIRIRKAAQFLF